MDRNNKISNTGGLGGIIASQDLSLFSGTLERPLHVAVFCASPDHATELMSVCQWEAQSHCEHLIFVEDPLKDVICSRQEEHNESLLENSQTPTGISSDHACLNHLGRSAWDAISQEHKGFAMLVKYVDCSHSDSSSSRISQILQTEKKIAHFLPEWSFGFPLSRFCFYILPEFSKRDIIKLISAHRHILFPTSSNAWKGSLAEDLLGRPERPVSLLSKMPSDLLNHVAFTAMGAPQTQFEFRSPMGALQAVARNLREFIECLPTLDQETFNHHLMRWGHYDLESQAQQPLHKPVLRSDFALWLAYGLQDATLAMKVFELAYCRTKGQDLAELSLFGQQMLQRAVIHTCANRLTFLEDHLAKAYALQKRNRERKRN